MPQFRNMIFNSRGTGRSDVLPKFVDSQMLSTACQENKCAVCDKCEGKTLKTITSILNYILKSSYLPLV